MSLTRTTFHNGTLVDTAVLPPPTTHPCGAMNKSFTKGAIINPLRSCELDLSLFTPPICLSPGSLAASPGGNGCLNQVAPAMLFAFRGPETALSVLSPRLGFTVSPAKG